jgi:hypothetical protein
MRRMLTAAVGTMLSVFAAGAWAQVDASITDEWGKLIAANNLDLKGNSPFHLEITFQLNDLDGKPTRSGTVEDWWAAPGSERVMVHLAGVNEDGSLAAGASHELVRDRYLVNELLNLAVHPVPELSAAREKVTNEKEAFGKLKLDCLGPESRQGSGGLVQYESVCMQPQSDLVLIRRASSENEVLARQSTGKFNDTHVALKLPLAYMGRIAITGEVTKLQSFDAAKPEVQLLSLSMEEQVMPNGPMHTALAKGVVVGKSIATDQPELPNGHRQGKAIVNMIFGKDGLVLEAVPIACSDAQFCNAAAKALANWKISPALLNGQPTEVNITTAIEVTGDSF